MDLEKVSIIVLEIQTLPTRGVGSCCLNIRRLFATTPKVVTPAVALARSPANMVRVCGRDHSNGIRTGGGGHIAPHRALSEVPRGSHALSSGSEKEHRNKIERV